MFGYVGFIALLFLPGLAFMLALKREGGGLVSLLARSYGLSLVMNSLAGVAGLFLRVPFLLLSWAWLAACLLFAVAVLVRRYKLSFLRVLSNEARKSSLVLLLCVAFGILVLLQFVKYPIFPKSLSADFVQHSQLVEVLLAGSTANAGWMLLYGGVHLNLAMGVSLEGGPVLIQLPILMALLTAPSSIVIYEVGMALYGSNRQALLAQSLYIITGFVWYVPLYDSGLYPNLYGTILALCYIVLLLRFRESSGWRDYSLLLLTTFGLYLSHYTAVLFIAAVAVYLLIRLALRKDRARFVATVVATAIAPASLVIFRPELLSLASSIIGYTGPSSTFPFSTPLADALSLSFFIRFLVAEIYSYADVVLLLFTLPIAMYYIWANRGKNSALLLIAVWFGILWASAPQGELTWRFSYEAMAPLIILAPASFEVIGRALAARTGSGRRQRVRKQAGPRRRGVMSGEAIAAVVLLVIVFSGSWAYAMVTDLGTDTAVYSSAQADLYKSMLWFNQSTPPQSKLLSVTDWRIAFMQQLTGRQGADLIFANATQALQYAEANGYGYVLVTYLFPVRVPPGFDAVTYYMSFADNPRLTEVYSNPTDVIYQVTG